MAMTSNAKEILAGAIFTALWLLVMLWPMVAGPYGWWPCDAIDPRPTWCVALPARPVPVWTVHP